MKTYKFIENSNKAVLQVIVKLEGKIVGHINPVIGGGWQYFPKGFKTGGEKMKTIQQIQNSLENDN